MGRTGSRAAAAVGNEWGRTVVEAVVSGRPGLVYDRRPRSLASLLNDASRWRGRTFLVQGDRSLTYDEFLEAVEGAAARLGEGGVRSGDRVVILAFNSIEWVVVFWGVAAIGAVPVMGNAWWSEEEVAEILDILSPQLVVSDREVPARSMPLSAFAVDRKEPVPVRPFDGVHEDAEGLVIFSSGTTGLPKGVRLSHRSIVGNLHNLLALTGHLPSDPRSDDGVRSALLTVPLFHLAGFQIMTLNMLSGGQVVMLRGRFDAEEVLQLIERRRIRTWGSIPTMVSRVLQNPGFTDADVTSIRSIPLGGAPVTPELRQLMADGFPSLRHSGGSLYGCTEAGGVVAAGAGAEMRERPGCVGRPLPVVEVRIREPDPAGLGEIEVRTPTVATGYVGSSTPLVDDEGWLPTGDLGRFDDDWLYVTGRSKDVIIRGGENVASVNVARHVSRHPGVAEAVAVGLPDADLGEKIGVVAILLGSGAVGLDELRAHARQHLGRHEQPDEWWLRRCPLPTTDAGKVLRREVLDDWLAAGGGTRVDLGVEGDDATSICLKAD